jgi:hypothetical protein
MSTASPSFVNETLTGTLNVNTITPNSGTKLSIGGNSLQFGNNLTTQSEIILYSSGTPPDYCISLNGTVSPPVLGYQTGGTNADHVWYGGSNEVLRLHGTGVPNNNSVTNILGLNGTVLSTKNNVVDTSSTQTLTNKTMDGGSNQFTNIPANRVVATNPNWPIVSSTSSQLIAVPYINASQGGTTIDTSSSTGIPSISSGTWSVSNTIGVDQINGHTNTSSNVTWNTGVTNQMIVKYFSGYLTDYFGTLVGNVVSTSAYVPLMTFTPTSGHSYLAIYYVSTYYTAGPQVGDARGQVTYSRFSNVGGTTTITTNFSNSDSHDYTQNGSNVQPNGTYTNKVDFVIWNVAGDTLNMSFYIRLLATP